MRGILNSSFPKNILLLIILISSPCLLILYILKANGIDVTIFRYLLLIITILVAITGIRRYHFTIFQKKIQIYFVVIITYLFIIWNVDILFSGSARNVFRIIILSPLLMIIMNNRKFNLNIFINLFIIFAFVLASLSIINIVECH